MLCKMATKKRSKKLWENASATNESNNNQKSKHACIEEAHKYTRKRLESTLPRDHEDHIAEKGCNSTSHYNLVHNSDAPSDANSGCEGSSGQGMGEARRVASVAIEQGEEQKRRSFWKHKERKRKSTLPH